MRILLVEDEPTLRAQLHAGLVEAGHVVAQADNGRDAHFMGDTEDFDAVVLDLGLPLMDGLTVLQRWRGQHRTMPVLILTARDNWHDKVAGIDAGADDYLTKPFHMEELLARLRALNRRANGMASAVLRLGDVALDTRSGRVTMQGQAVALTSPVTYTVNSTDAVRGYAEISTTSLAGLTHGGRYSVSVKVNDVDGAVTYSPAAELTYRTSVTQPTLNLATGQNDSTIDSSETSIQLFVSGATLNMGDKVVLQLGGSNITTTTSSTSTVTNGVVTVGGSSSSHAQGVP